jgi:hypothetical protein
MNSELKDLEDIIELCVKKGVKRIKLPDLELELGGDGPTLEEKKELKFLDPDMDMPQGDDMLNWSTPLEELKETKQ